MPVFSKKDRYSNQFIKHNVEVNEYNIHKIVYNLGLVNVPEIYHYDKPNKIMSMKKINQLCLSDMYGADASSIPIHIFNQIREIIKILHYNYIDYPDITGYNFIEDKTGKVWIIDFGHAKCRNLNEKSNPFITKFIDGFNGWNPRFK